MARKINGRIVVSGQLETLGPLHVGSGDPSPETDLPLARNGAGQLYVPGTSLAGALREWCTESLGSSGDELLKEVWGPWVPKKTTDGQAAYLFVEDAAVRLADGQTGTEIRDGVGIDRQWGVAATRFKFDRAILPKGTSLDLRLILELPPKHDGPARSLLRHLLQALRQGEVRLGACKTRGMGRVALAGPERVRFEDVNSRAGILRILRDQDEPGADPLAAGTPLNVQPASRLNVRVAWRAVGPVMVKSGADGLAVDMLPLLSGCGAGVALVIPGSSAKGVLRSHAERILRTLLGRHDPRWPERPDRRFAAQLDVPLVREVFGSPARSPRDGNGQASGMGGRSALSVDDTYAAELAGRPDPNAFATAAELDQLKQRLAAAQRQDWAVAHHVAIDRWTGGAAESFLYSVLEPLGEDWSPLELSLDLRRLREDLQKPAVALLLLLLRDLAARRLPIGFGGNRGLGEMEVTQIELSGATEDAGLGRGTIVLPGGELAGLPDGSRERLTGAWQEWLSEQGSGRG